MCLLNLDHGGLLDNGSMPFGGNIVAPAGSISTFGRGRSEANKPALFQRYKYPFYGRLAACSCCRVLESAQENCFVRST